VTVSSTELSPTGPAVPTKRLRLAFLNNVPFTDAALGGSAQGLKDGVELFRIAEQLGYDSGWVRMRHFDNYLSSPLPLIAVAAQKTERIRLGTAIIPVGYDDPIRLAEDAATVDLLSDNRLELGIATGIPSFGSIFGHDGSRPWKDQAYDRVLRVLAGIEGRALGTSPQGVDYTVRPHSPTLRSRVWYGPGGVDSAARAGEEGLDLLLSAIGPNIGVPFDEAQLAQINALRESWTRTDRSPRVSAARLFFPALNDRQRKLYQGYADLRAAEGPAASRPAGALPPEARRLDVAVPTGAPGIMSPVVVGEPAEIVEYLRSDVAVAESDELMIFLPPGFNQKEYIELLENIAEHVAAELGWSPAP
jgi:alkanesulfonate monooxygenase SsuD/methylene tetrahydromethanopterin reductase-like flavin-dependent oxidoreductase (luciferase family)